MKTRKSNYYNQKFYAIFRRDENDKLLGFIEHSFTMGWDDKLVRVWPEKRFDPGFFGNKAKVDKWMGCSDYIIVRVNSKKCPVHIKLMDTAKNMGKFEFRNKPFAVKPSIP